MFKKLKKPNGITLIALIITIVVLLILAGVSISLVVGDNGVLTQASSSVVTNREAKAKEEVKLAWAGVDAEYWSAWAGNTSLDRVTYFTEGTGNAIGRGRLNKYLTETGEITEGPSYNTTTGEYTVKYKAKDQNKTYTFIIDERGNISKKKGISVEPGSAKIEVNGTVQLSAELDGIEGTVTWTSDNPGIATVSASGLVTGVAKGDTTIKATCGEESDTCSVKVTKVYTVKLYDKENTTNSPTEIRIEEEGNVFNDTNYATAKTAANAVAPSGQKLDKWMLKTAVGGSAVGTDATSLLSNVTENLDVYATFKEVKLYGESVQLNGGNAITVKTVGTTNYTIEDKWKLFYIDDAANGYVHLIYGDYYPEEVQTEIMSGNAIFAPAHKSSSSYKTDSTYLYSVNSGSDRLTLLKYLKNNSSYAEANLDTSIPVDGSYDSWDNLKTALTGSGKALNGKTIRVQGAPNITMWKESWNEQGYTELALDDTGNTVTGYNIRLATAAKNSSSNYYISLSGYSGYNDTLYFPYQNTTAGNGKADKAAGYWLASPGGYSADRVCDVRYLGIVSCSYRYYDDDRAARPVVSILKSDFESIEAFSGISIEK